MSFRSVLQQIIYNFTPQRQTARDNYVAETWRNLLKNKINTI